MKAIRLIGLLAVIAAAFSGGYIYKAVRGGTAASATRAAARSSTGGPDASGLQVRQAGIAPDCGMKLEPVYADGGTASAPASGARTTFPPWKSARFK